MNSKLSKTAIKNLKFRISVYWAALETCTTDAQEKCVLEQIEATTRVLARGRW